MKNRPSNVGLVVELTRQADALTRGHPSAGLDYPKLVRRLAAAEIGIIWAAHNLGFRQATTAVGPEIRARALTIETSTTSTARNSRALPCQRSLSLAALDGTLPDGLASMSDFYAAMIAEAEAAGAPGQPAADEGEL